MCIILQLKVCNLQSVVCGLQFANVIHRLITGLTKIQFLGGNASIPPNTPKMGGGGGGGGLGLIGLYIHCINKRSRMQKAIDLFTVLITQATTVHLTTKLLGSPDCHRFP